ncbi:MAG: hypothetical protein ABR951_00930 [Candidatus Aminicenantales bacterium]
MAGMYQPETIRGLEKVFAGQEVLRPIRPGRYEPGTVLEYDVRGVVPDGRARARLEVEKYVGGGYAGQVYRVKLLALETIEGKAGGLEAGGRYALKILTPASGLGRRIRNLFYGVGFQAPFSLQSLSAAGRSQALWQKFIRRTAKIELGTEAAVVDIHATFVDHRVGSYGEISEWVDGRMWRLEVDDDLDARRRFRPGDPETGVGSPEYRTKHAFMDRLVRLLREIGAEELARQYEWWSLKSQPNAMKRTASDPDPRAGLVAVDFRAGMALLPVLPECPADVKLILRGFRRGRLVQFDKGDVRKLEAYVEAHGEDFADMREALGTLKREDKAYRDSLVDITYHHVRLFGARLRRSIMAGFRESWRVRNMTDERAAARLEKSGALSLLFLLMGLAPVATPVLLLLAWPGRTWWHYPVWSLPLFAPLVRRLWGRADLRRHYGRLLASPRYFGRSVRAHIAEALIRWVRSGRVSEPRALLIAAGPWRYFPHLPLSVLPAGLHRFLTDEDVFKASLARIFVRPFKLYFNAGEREKWLRDMVAAGQRNGMLTSQEAAHITGQIKEPFIQKYLKSLAIHLLLMPTTHVVALIVAFFYVRLHPELTWQQATLAAGVIFGIFQIIPISPGSLARGIYTSSLVLRERNFKDYSIAFGLSFFKYIGYLAFPIQMAYRYPDLARFMAAHWATSAVHIVPVFGEKGAWLEHFVFDAFYNFPLTVQRRVKRRAEARKALTARYAQAPLLVLAGTALLAGLDFAWFKATGAVPSLKNVWWMVLWVPAFVGAFVSRAAGGVPLGRRILLGTASGALAGLLYALANTFLPALYGAAADPGGLAVKALWHIFLFTLVAAVGAMIAETRRA